MAYEHPSTKSTYPGMQAIKEQVARRLGPFLQVPKKEYILRGLSEDDTRDWFDVMRPIPQVCVPDILLTCCMHSKT